MMPLPNPTTNPGAEHEGPAVDRYERLADDEERARVGARGILPQRHDDKQRDDADGDEDGFDDPRDHEPRARWSGSAA